MPPPSATSSVLERGHSPEDSLDESIFVAPSTNVESPAESPPAERLVSSEERVAIEAYNRYLSWGSLSGLSVQPYKLLQQTADQLDNGRPHHLYARGWLQVEMAFLPYATPYNRERLLTEAGESWIKSVEATNSGQSAYDLKDRFQSAMAYSYLPVLKGHLNEHGDASSHLLRNFNEIAPQIATAYDEALALDQANQELVKQGAAERDYTNAGKVGMLASLMRELEVAALFNRAGYIAMIALPREDYGGANPDTSVKDGFRYRWDVTTLSKDLHQFARVQVRSSGNSGTQHKTAEELRALSMSARKKLYHPDITVISTSLMHLKTDIEKPFFRLLIEEAEGKKRAKSALDAAEAYIIKQTVFGKGFCRKQPKVARAA